MTAENTKMQHCLFVHPDFFLVSENMAFEGFVFPENHTAQASGTRHNPKYTAVKCKMFKASETRRKGFSTPAAAFHPALLSAHDIIIKM